MDRHGRPHRFTDSGLVAITHRMLMTLLETLQLAAIKLWRKRGSDSHAASREQMFQRSFSGAAVPQRRHLPSAFRSREYLLEVVCQPLNVRQTVAATRHGDRPFRVRPKRKAWCSKISRFFLQPSGI